MRSFGVSSSQFCLLFFLGRGAKERPGKSFSVSLPAKARKLLFDPAAIQQTPIPRAHRDSEGTELGRCSYLLPRISIAGAAGANGTPGGCWSLALQSRSRLEMAEPAALLAADGEMAQGEQLSHV